jgi:hypothetical protein
MFKIEHQTELLPDFNTNKLIIKVPKEFLSGTKLEPGKIKSSAQKVEPAKEELTGPMFEIY